MRKILLIALSTLLPFCSIVQAQDDDALLWEISGNGLAQPSYLFGTIHLLCPDDIKITEAIKNAMSDAKQLVLELDLDEPGVMNAMQQAAMMTDGTTLNDLLSEEEYEKVGKYLQDSLSIPIQALNTMKPIMLSTLMYLDVLDCQPGSYEMNLTQLAQDQDKEVLGLEVVEDQVKAFDFIPLEEQSDYLVEAIEQYDKTISEISSMIEAYKNGQLSRLNDLTQESMKEMKGAEEALLTSRNQKWIPSIENMAKEQATFFAVGAGHLGGAQGVIALLREQGYTVEAIN